MTKRYTNRHFLLLLFNEMYLN